MPWPTFFDSLPSFSPADSASLDFAVQTMLYSAGTNTSIGCPEVRTAMDALNTHTLEWFCRGCEDEVLTRHQNNGVYKTPLKSVLKIVVRGSVKFG